MTLALPTSAEPMPELRDWLRSAAHHAPGACALECDGLHVSYAQLFAKVQCLSARLRAAGLVAPDRVGIAATRSIHTVVAILAALEAGLGYVPLDLGYPAARLRAMLQDAQPRVILGEPAAIAELRARVGARGDGRVGGLAGAPMAALVDALAGDLPTLDRPAPAGERPHGASPDLAYVLFTSGSTGQPKGVAMGAAPLRHLIAWHAKHPRLGRPARTLQFAPLSFDVHFQEVLSTVACRGTLVMLPESHRKDPALLNAWLIEHRVARLFVPFVALQMLASSVRGAVPGCLREVISAGEQLHVTPAIRALFARLPGAELHNHYGPTEAHVVTAFELRGDPAAWPDIPPIGRALPHVRLAMRPDGSGELLLGGETLANGYIGRPALSAQVFRSDIAGLPGRWYCTGDLAACDADGVYRYGGRIDTQVKIRGHRVELGEVEAAIEQHPAVRQVAVVAREDAPGDKRLVAYVVAGEPRAALGDALRTRLRELLPPSMVPAHFVFVDALPTAPSGKVDRQALPAPAEAKRDASPFAPPRDAGERAVWNIWCEVLKTKDFGVSDDFFDAGGDSLLAVELGLLLQDHFATEVPLSIVLQAPTVAMQAAVFAGQAAASDTLVAIRRGGAHGPKLFLVHDGFGATLLYRNLANRLDPGISVYGLQPEARDGVAMVHTRIEDIAAAYIARIRRVQPSGPYFLGGLCGGGTIAYAMARQLQRSGEAIGMLALLEANDVAAQKKRRYGFGRRWWIVDGLHAGVSWADPLGSVGTLLGFGLEAAQLTVQKCGLRARGLVTRLRASVLRYCLDRGRRPPMFAKRLSVDQIYLYAESGYVIDGVFAGDLILFRARRGNGVREDEPFANLYADPLMGWGRRVSGSVVGVDVEGGHFTLLQEPNVRAMAEVVQANIDRVLVAMPA